MPGGDGRGPNGAGPMSGKGMGYCVGRPPATGGQWIGRGAGRAARFGGGYGRGAGYGRGYGQGFGYGAGSGFWAAGRNSPIRPAPMSVQEEKDLLRSEESQLSQSLQNVKDRLSRLENENVS